MSDFVLKRKSLTKSVRNYCWFLLLGSLALFFLVFLGEIGRYVFGEQGLLDTLGSIWFPILLLIIVLVGFRLIRRATKERVYALLGEDYLEFPNIPKSHYYDGLPAFRKWPIAEVRSARTEFVKDPQLIDNYGFREGLALYVEGAYWSIFMPAKKLDYVAKFVGKLNQKVKASSSQDRSPDTRRLHEQSDKSFTVSRSVIVRELYILALYIAMATCWFGLVVFYIDELIILIPGLVMGLYSACGIFQRALVLTAAKQSRMTINNGVLSFVSAKNWWVSRGLLSAFDLPKESIDLKAVKFIRYSQFPISKQIFPWLFFRSFISENITLVVDEKECTFYNLFEQSDEVLKHIFDQVATNVD